MYAIDTPTARALDDGLAMERLSTPLALLSPHPSLPRNTLGGGCSSAWPLSPLPPGLPAYLSNTPLPPGFPAYGSGTPMAVKPLGVDASCHSTPCTIPALPLLSPSALPCLGHCLGIGPGALAGSSMGRSLEQVVSVATDPLSLHFVNLNMVTVELNEESMDALMEGHLPGQDKSSPLGCMLTTSPTARLLPSPLSGQGKTNRTLFKARRRTNGEEAEGTDAEVHAAKRVLCGAYDEPNGGGEHGSRRASLFSQASTTTRDLHAGAELGMPRGAAALATDGDSGDAAGGAHAAVAAAAAEGEDGLEEGLDLSVPFLEENGYFDMTLQAAAVQLGVGVTTLKKLCRQNGLGRWPYRARCSLRKLRDKMREYFACAPAEERDAADALMAREFSRLARMNVGAIDEAVKQFRQAMFKLEFKARQQLGDARGNGGGRKRPGSASSCGGGGDGAGGGGADLNAIIHGDQAIWQQAMVHLRRLLNNCAEEPML